MFQPESSGAEPDAARLQSDYALLSMPSFIQFLFSSSDVHNDAHDVLRVQCSVHCRLARLLSFPLFALRSARTHAILVCFVSLQPLTIIHPSKCARIEFCTH